DAGPDAECLVAGPTRHTRRSLDDAAHRVGHALLERVVRSGDRVGIYARNRAEYVEALLGCWKIAACPININWRYVADELRYLLDDAAVAALIVESEYVPLVCEGADALPRMRARLVLDDVSEAGSIASYAEALATSRS